MRIIPRRKTFFSVSIFLSILFTLTFPALPDKTRAEMTIARPSEFTLASFGGKRIAARPAPPDMGMEHRLAASYYNLNNGLSGTLVLSDQGPHQMDVHVTLFSLEGARLDAPTIMLAGNTVGSFDLREWAILGGSAFQEGSVQVDYSGKDMELGGVVKLVDADRSLIFDEELSEPAMDFASSRLEGVWWLPSHKSDMRLIVSNTTDAPVTTTVSVDGIAPGQKEAETLTLSPHETRAMDVQDFIAKRLGTLLEIGGMSISHSGPKGAVLARALIQEPATGYSNVVEFSDPLKAKTSKLDGAGLRIGAIGSDELRQVAVARNVGDAPADLTGRIAYTTRDGSSGSIALPATHLAPGEAKAVKLTGAIKGSGLNSVTAAGLEFTYTSAPGSVVMSAQSVSKSENNVFRVPMVDAATISSSTGQYPWGIDGSSSTFVYLKNATDKPQQYHLQINFADGVYSLGMKTIEPEQPIMFDLRALRDNQVPDAKGRTIPLNATGGQVHWSIDGDEPRGIIGRVEQADITNGMSMTAACAECCPDSWYGFWMSPVSATGFPGDTTQFSSIQQNQTCYNEVLEPFTVPYPTWSSTDPSVATCDSTGLATAQLPGFAHIQSRWTVRFWDFDPINGTGCTRYLEQALADALCDVLAVQFLDVKVVNTNRTASFDLFNNADLNPDTPDGPAACSGDNFFIKATFRLPKDSVDCCGDLATLVALSGDNKFQLLDWTFAQNEDKKSGFVVIQLKKRSSGGTTNSVRIAVGGTYGDGTSYRGQGTVHLICP